MGNLVVTAAFTEASELPTRSVGAKRRRRLLGYTTMSTSYATGGDTIAVGDIPTGQGVLKEVQVLRPFDGTRFYVWDRNIVTPKIQAFTASAVEVANTTNLSTIVLPIEFVFEQG